MIDAWRASKQTVPDFARRMGLGVDRLYRWRRRLGDAPMEGERAGRGAAALLPVIVREKRAVVASVGSAVTVFTREGIRVEVGEMGAESAAWVARLVRALGEVAP